MADRKNELDINTQLVHAGERRATPNGLPVATPIYTSANCTYDTMAEIDQGFAGETPGFIYTRYGKPTTAAFEVTMTVLEGGDDVCAYVSVMAAFHAALFF